MSEVATALAMSVVRALLMWRRALMWKKVDLLTAEICSVKVRWLSSMTPRVLIWSDNGTVVPATVMPDGAGKVRRRCRVPKTIDSDLSPLRDKPLEQNQE